MSGDVAQNSTPYALAGEQSSAMLFSGDHKSIALRHLALVILASFLGIALTLAVRWHITWPWSEIPLIDSIFFAQEGGLISPLFSETMRANQQFVWIHLVMVGLLLSVLGGYLVPLMIGASELAFPRMNQVGFWFTIPAFVLLMLSFFQPAVAMSLPWVAIPVSGMTHTTGEMELFLPLLGWISLFLLEISWLIQAMNCLVTVGQKRAEGLGWLRLPMTVWGFALAALVQWISLPQLGAETWMQIGEHLLGGVAAADREIAFSNWLMRFESYSQSMIYVALLPAIGIVTDVATALSRKSLVGYQIILLGCCGIAGLGVAMPMYVLQAPLQHAVSPDLFRAANFLIVLPLAIIIGCWIATVGRSCLEWKPPLMFAIGGGMMLLLSCVLGVIEPLRGVGLGAQSQESEFSLHKSQFNFALAGAIVCAGFAAIYFWFPKFSGRSFNTFWGSIHCLSTVIGLGLLLVPMQWLGERSFVPEVIADSRHVLTDSLRASNYFLTICCGFLACVQLIFLVNIVHGLMRGTRCGRNPWNANSLEWTAPSPPTIGNFDFHPRVYRGAYEYGVISLQSGETLARDFKPQNEAQHEVP